MKFIKSTINKISFLLVLILLSWKLQGQEQPIKVACVGNTITFPTNGMRVKTVRYAWRPYSRGNLVNEAGLPASTFEILCKQL
jgi:hypothetical protein